MLGLESAEAIGVGASDITPARSGWFRTRGLRPQPLGHHRPQGCRGSAHVHRPPPCGQSPDTGRVSSGLPGEEGIPARGARDYVSSKPIGSRGSMALLICLHTQSKRGQAESPCVLCVEGRL